jgi:hypothetical protein
MFLFKTLDELNLPKLEEELQELRKPPYDTIEGLEAWRKKTDAMLTMMRTKVVTFFVMGFPVLFIGLGLVLWWRGAYWIHAIRIVKRMRDEAYAIRLRELHAPVQPAQSPVTR